METTLGAPVSFTANAIAEIRRLMNAESFDNTKALRVGVKGGGCSGIRYWRDNFNAGRLSFGEGFKLGTLITLFPSIAFGLFTLLQLNVLEPDFNNRYYAHYVQKVKASTPPERIQETLQKLESEKEMFASPFMQFSIMFLTVFLIGIVITVISSLILQRSGHRAKTVAE